MKIRVCRFAVPAMLLFLVAATVAHAQTSCSASITACGCTIYSAGTYTVEADLTASQGLTSHNGCIDINTSNVTLLANGYSITGAGTDTGIGIHLMSGRSNIFLSAAGPQSTYTVISGWQYGMESQAQTVTGEAFYLTGNSTGLLLKGATRNNFGCMGAFDNTVYGIWVSGGSNNSIDYPGLWDNTVAGLYIGCSASGPTGPACSGTSTGNVVFEIMSYNIGAQSYGLVVQNGNTGNTLVDNQSYGNTVDDMFDGNASGSSNTWYANLFATANQSYIQ